MLASKGGHEQVVRALLEVGASVDLAHKDGVTALLYAVEGKHFRVVDVLVKAGADPKARTKTGRSPMKLAASTRSQEITQIFRRAEELQTMVVTLHPLVSNFSSDMWCVACTSMGGEELASLETLGSERFSDFGSKVQQDIGEGQTVRFILPSGLRISNEDYRRTVSDLFFEEHCVQESHTNLTFDL